MKGYSRWCHLPASCVSNVNSKSSLKSLTASGERRPTGKTEEVEDTTIPNALSYAQTAQKRKQTSLAYPSDSNFKNRMAFGIYDTWGDAWGNLISRGCRGTKQELLIKHIRWKLSYAYLIRIIWIFKF